MHVNKHGTLEEMKKILGLMILVFIFIIGYKYYVSWFGNTTAPKETFVQVGAARFSIEIADTDNKRAQGLSDRESLPQNSGMLFVFPTSDTYAFWMHRMKFPLDFVWIKGDKVVDLTENVPQPLTETYAPPTIKPKEPVDKVLEINAGEIKKNDIKIGDTFSLSLLNPLSSPAN